MKLIDIGHELLFRDELAAKLAISEIVAVNRK